MHNAMPMLKENIITTRDNHNMTMIGVYFGILYEQI